jgi:hypothetical protein
MKITASNSKAFVKIEEGLGKIDPDFLKKFASAEYVAEGYIQDIKLTAELSFEDKIILPKKFIVSSIIFNDYVVIDKTSEGEPRENQKYQIEIEGKIDEQGYKFIYTNLYKVHKEICYR